MVLVRGVKGNLKLNPSLKLWVSLAIFAILISVGILLRFSDFREQAGRCEAAGGVWISMAIPVRLGLARSLPGYCSAEMPPEDEK
jgi:hypothetical protein